MINFKQANKFCKEDLSLIENYEAALNSDIMYVCHHKNGIILNKNRKELKELDLYYSRPANELMFLTHSEHITLHRKGKRHTEESKQKMSGSLKGRSSPRKGVVLSDKTKQKLSAQKKGRHWKLVDGKRVWY